jgi:hypothetical protein
MPVQMIELEEVTMVETTDEFLEATVAEVRGGSLPPWTGMSTNVCEQ